MTIKRRIQKLEGKRGIGCDQVKVIIREIIWADGAVAGFHGQALTPTGWQTTMGNADMGREAFEAKLWAMVKGAAQRQNGAE